MQEQLTTRQIATALQVSESSVKRWCDRGVIPTIRTVGGHRRIPLAGFMHFLEQTNQQVIVPLDGKVVGDVEVEQEFSDESATAIRERFIEALSRGDEETCRTTLIHSFAQHDSLARLADEIIAPALHRLGEQWQCGELEVYQERRGCGICSHILHELKRVLPAPPNSAPLAIGGTPEGDQYTLPSQLIETMLQQLGWQPMNLGSNVPLASIAAAARTHNPRLLWLSISHIVDEEKFVAEYSDFYASLPSQLSVVLGGRALTDRLRPRLRYTGFCDNMQQLASFAAALNVRRQSLQSSSN
jgi:MerR family transcriptional regulator, light-induced transcriptional regulator